ncbi:hypothetical protein E8D34_11940 [Nocardioides sp. GY 10113]|uniref:DUF6542 domain-containing protein n=1 Tax=Nocardioides sp. GY 10113 TaxID=2569761 RepID=UPI0010A8EBFE|nr:DUF6542 domain-containing protein [Nocardioides sp. GY 10113]TIC85814.1 hypothetical protein E8D34_11940 [Nocardioides sp. GY 10113]
MTTVRRRARPQWEQGRATGRDVVSLSVALIGTALVIDLALSEVLGIFFDLAFVTICLGAALAVRHRDFFAIGTLPPLAMVAAVALVALTEPAAVADPRDGAVQATLSGLTHHSIALVCGYGLCLGALGVRRALAATDAADQRTPRG